jgi:hypothetical protein
VDLNPEELEGIRGNAALIMRDLSPLTGFEVGLDERSVEWVEGFLERQRERGTEYAEAIVDVVGSYLGEAIIAAAGGVWARQADGWIGIRFSEKTWAFPFNKTRKQAQNGLAGGDSIASFYRINRDLVATGKLGQSSAPESQEQAPQE